MIETQLKARGISDEHVLAAMASLPRERFVPDVRRAIAYADEALPIPAGQTISQPWVVARMTELLAPHVGDRVLDVGTGSGYQAAILALLGARVLSIERQPELAESARVRLAELGFADQVEVRLGDGSLGDPTGARWDGIIVAAAAPAIPNPLREQLSSNGGRLVIPVGDRQRQDLLLMVRNGDTWDEKNDGAVVFVPLVGEEGFPG